MQDFPKWLLVLAFLDLVPALLSVFFLFGGVLAAPAESGSVVRFFVYVAVQLLWILPVAAFFAGLDRYRRGYERIGLALLLLGLLFTVGDILLLL